MFTYQLLSRAKQTQHKEDYCNLLPIVSRLVRTKNKLQIDFSHQPSLTFFLSGTVKWERGCCMSLPLSLCHPSTVMLVHMGSLPWDVIHPRLIMCGFPTGYSSWRTDPTTASYHKAHLPGAVPERGGKNPQGWQLPQIFCSSPWAVAQARAWFFFSFFSPLFLFTFFFFLFSFFFFFFSFFSFSLLFSFHSFLHFLLFFFLFHKSHFCNYPPLLEV